MYYKRGEAVVTLFKTKTKSQRNLTKQKIYSNEIWYGSALKRYNVELSRNGGRTTAIAELFLGGKRR